MEHSIPVLSPLTPVFSPLAPAPETATPSPMREMVTPLAPEENTPSDGGRIGQNQYTSNGLRFVVSGTSTSFGGQRRSGKEFGGEVQCQQGASLWAQ